MVTNQFPSLSPSFVCFLADTSPKPAKRPKCAQGFHVSKNAYTLVYTLKGHKGVGKTASSAVVYQKWILFLSQECPHLWLHVLGNFNYKFIELVWNIILVNDGLMAPKLIAVNCKYVIKLVPTWYLVKFWWKELTCLWTIFGEIPIEDYMFHLCKL